ncbi:MAG: hypothetical protein V4685_18295 [Bacteroidota bacterium]
MKKTLQSAVLIVLAASAIFVSATSRQPNVKNYWPDEWQETSKQSVKDSNNEATYSNKIFNNKN